MYNLVNDFLEGIIIIVQGYCLQYFCGSFLEGRLSKRKWNGMFVVVLYGISKWVVNLLIVSDYKSIRILAKQALFFCVLLGVLLCCYKAVHKITFFLVVTFMAINEISNFLGFVVISMGNGLINIWSWCMEKGYINSLSLGTFFTSIKITVVLTKMLTCMADLLMVYFGLRRILKSFTEKDYQMQKTELLFILTPGLISLLICMLLRIIMITVENDVPKLLYDRYPVLAVIVPVTLLLSLLSILFGVKLFQDMISLNREKNSRGILEKQISSMQEHIREIECIYSGIRSIRHDMKNTLSVAMQLDGGRGEKQAYGGMESEELKTYLSELNESIDRLAFEFKTGNIIADTLFTMKYHEIIYDIPDLEMDMDSFILPDTLFIHSYDLSVILGNALDNALEACRKLKSREPDAETFIRSTSFQKGSLLFLKIENSFDGNVIQKPKAEFPATDKEDKGIHGIGLANIKNTVEKYEGAVDWKVRDKVFILSVMLKNEGWQMDDTS